MENPAVEIVLATYNGAAHLADQLHSLEAQTVEEWRLRVRDDGSGDGTTEILERFAEDHPERVVLLQDAVRGLGPAKSFGRLLEASAADRVLLCDQDDVWRPEKIAAMLDAFDALEARHGPHTPLLLHSDLEVVDEELNRVAPSFWAYQHLHPGNADRLERELMMNVVTGSATMVNQALIRRALPVPEEAIMHDWWLALVVAAFGRAGHLDKRLVQYRQHGANSIGARRHDPLATFWRILRTRFRPAERRRRRDEVHASVRRHRAQARAFRDRFATDLSPAQHEILEAHQALYQHPRILRLCPMLRHGLLRTGILRNLGVAAIRPVPPDSG
jgi:glycosyltransferase involved in cell wall biosynthesis